MIGAEDYLWKQYLSFLSFYQAKIYEIYNTGDGLNLTKRRGRKFISHGDKVQERKNRQLAITRKSPPETMVTNTVCTDDDMENLTPNLPRVALPSLVTSLKVIVNNLIC